MGKNLSCTQCSHYWIIAYKRVNVMGCLLSTGQLITLNIKKVEE